MAIDRRDDVVHVQMKLDIIEFALRFVRLMRRSPECANKPSTRQAVSIPRLLVARALRLGKLTPGDLVYAAVVTSPPENQMLAEKTAEEILLHWGEPPLEEQEALDEEAEAALEEIQRILHEIALAKTIQKSGLDRAMGFAQWLRQARLTGEVEAAMQILGGPWGVLKRNISDSSEMMRQAQEEARLRIGSLSPDELRACVQLGLAEEIVSLSPRSWERALAKMLSGQQSLQEALNEPSLSSRDAIRVLYFVRLLFPERQQELKHLAEELAGRIQSLEELYEALRSLGWLMPAEGVTGKVLEDALKRYDFVEGYELAKAIDQNTHHNVREEYLERWQQACEQSGKYPSLSQLARCAFRSVAWYEMLEQAARMLREQLEQSPNPAHELFNAASDCLNWHESASDIFAAQHLFNFAVWFADASLAQSASPVQLKGLVKALRAMNLPLEERTILERGRQLGMSEEELMELLSPSFELLRRAIRSGVEDFDRLSDMIKAVQPDSRQMLELVKAALRSDNQGALGALGHYDLNEALQAAGQLGGQRAMEAVVSSLTAGPGENLLVQWFKHRGKLPKKVVKQVKELAKKVLLELGIHYSRARLGSSETGPIPISELRPFSLGDDPDLVDVEESLDNILAKGKSIALLDYSDLLIEQTALGRRAVCIELDISGSMSGEKLAFMALCTTFLVYGMRKDELALCFFESNTHKVKDIGEETNWDELAEQLLNLQAGGGTMVEKALEWAQRNFDESEAKDKLNVIFTDSEIFDLERALPRFSRLHSQGVRVVMVVPEHHFSASSARRIAQASKGFLVKVSRWEKFPDVLAQVVRE